MQRLGLVLILLVSVFSTVLSQSWNKEVLFEHPVSLNCTDPSVRGIREFTYWLDPNGNIVNENYTSTYYFFAGPGRGLKEGTIEASPEFLNISNVLEQHFGVYFCVITQNGVPVSLKRGINVEGPYFGNLWDKYKDSTLIGCLAAGGFLLVVLILTLVYVFRFDGPRPLNKVVHDLKEKRSKSKTSPQVQTVEGETVLATVNIKSINHDTVNMVQTTTIPMDPVSTLPGQPVEATAQAEVAQMEEVAKIQTHM